MDKKTIIEGFLCYRPDVEGAFGYGSGVIKQESYTNQDKPQIDMILVTKDIKNWHTNNIIRNPRDYSFAGRFRLSYLSRSQMKGPNNIVYCSYIQEKNYLFKYGLIETSDFINDLNTWDNFYVAGRFHKPMLEIKSNEEINEAIERNRLSAFMIACLLSDEYTNYYDIFKCMCNFSYMGDIRMGIAENPDKVNNIVKGSFEELCNIYKDFKFVEPIKNSIVKVNYGEILKNFNLLPDDLVRYLDEHVEKSLCFSKRFLLIRKCILDYFVKKNRIESVTQAIDGFKNNGLAKSIPYVASKLSKKMRKK